MDRDKITNEVLVIFKETFKDENIILIDDMTADDVDNWDSLNHTLLILNLETHFSIKFKLREVIKLKNVGVLLDTIENKLG